MRRVGKKQENNCASTYIYMCYRCFTFGVFPAFKRCGVVVLIEISAQKYWIGSVNRKFYCHSYY